MHSPPLFPEESCKQAGRQAGAGGGPLFSPAAPLRGGRPSPRADPPQAPPAQSAGTRKREALSAEPFPAREPEAGWKLSKRSRAGAMTHQTGIHGRGAGSPAKASRRLGWPAPPTRRPPRLRGRAPGGCLPSPGDPTPAFPGLPRSSTPPPPKAAPLFWRGQRGGGQPSQQWSGAG